MNRVLWAAKDKHRRARTRAIANAVIARALCDFSAENVTRSANDITAILNSGQGGAQYDHDQLLGTPGGAKYHRSGECLTYAAGFVQTPDAAANRITGDNTFEIALRMNDLTPAAQSLLAVKWDDASNQRSYIVAVSTAGNVQYIWSTDGTGATVSLVASTVTLDSVGLSADELFSLRVSLDVDNGASGHTITFEYKTDEPGATWQALGAPVTLPGTTSVHAGNQPVTMGVNLAGSLKRVQAFKGTVRVLDFNPLDYPNDGATSFTSATTGETWTMTDAFCQNTNSPIIHNSGVTAFETAAEVDVANPLTTVTVCRTTAPSATALVFDSHSTAGKTVSLATFGDQWIFSGAGGALSLSPTDLQFRAAAFGYFGDPTSTAVIPGIGTAVGDVGNAAFGVGTLLANSAGIAVWSGALVRHLLIEGALTPEELGALEFYFAEFYNYG